MLWLLFLHVTIEHLQVDLRALEALKEKNNMYVSFNVYTKIYMEQYCYVCIICKNLSIQRDF